ncbi:MAG: hypothetical protein EP330_07540 [Deltaproteobacteria bacterium]|nr:MAG: hypothetical protein EP330_07540 [Deltaproteobacteria bacterium]
MRLTDRDKPLKPPREVLGAAVKVGEPKVRDNRAKVHPGPNAPLLKRLVMFPYRQELAYFRRQSRRDPVPWDMLTREELPTVVDLINERPQPVQESIVKSAMVRVVRRERPSVSEWLEGRR